MDANALAFANASDAIHLRDSESIFAILPPSVSVRLIAGKESTQAMLYLDSAFFVLALRRFIFRVRFFSFSFSSFTRPIFAFKRDA